MNLPFAAPLIETEEDIKEIEKENFEIKEGNISLILDTYDDIFSDFDPRPYAERALSDDFLIECNRASRDKTQEQGIELRLLIPKIKRNKPEEVKIKKRLKDHFIKHTHQKQRDLNAEKKSGGIWFVAGTVLITASTLIYNREGMFFNFLLVMLEPAGWFTIWNGLDRIFIGTKERKNELEFYQKMSKGEITFNEY